MDPLTKKYYFKWDRTIYPEDSYIQYSVFRQNNKHTNINNYADFKKRNNRTNIYLKDIEYKGNTIHLKKPLFEKFFFKEGILSVLKRLNDDDI